MIKTNLVTHLFLPYLILTNYKFLVGITSIGKGKILKELIKFPSFFVTKLTAIKLTAEPSGCQKTNGITISRGCTMSDV